MPLLQKTVVPSLGRLRILVVEDSKPLAEIFSLILQEMGHEVAVAESGPAALARLSDRRPDVVFSDISMPGMSGYELAEKIREQANLASVFLVAMTGYAQPEDRVRALSAGFDDHLVKPAAQEQLESVLGRLAMRRDPAGGDAGSR